jgi:hypothetical protein
VSTQAWAAWGFAAFGVVVLFGMRAHARGASPPPARGASPVAGPRNLPGAVSTVAVGRVLVVPGAVSVVAVRAGLLVVPGVHGDLSPL